jgi:ferrous iron transport protein B
LHQEDPADFTTVAQDQFNIALIGNPNTGKTLLFNHLTGSHQKVANFSGITVAGKTGYFKSKGRQFNITDLPGIYGFSSNKPEEEVTLKYIHDNNIDLIINVVDASKLERNLFLTLQLLQKKKNMIIVLNFIDKVEQMQIEIDLVGLQNKLLVPVITTSAIRKTGFDELEKLITMAIVNRHNHSESTISVSGGIMNTSTHIEYVTQQYDLIQEMIDLYTTSEPFLGQSRRSFSDKLDRFLLHNILGFFIFVVIMGLVFITTFIISTPISDLLEQFASKLSEIAINNISNDLLASFIADGLIGGIGFVLVFIPQILILFIFLSLLEHTGYMARVVFITDRFLNKLGISGKSIAPMLLGMGCNVPAIMSTNSISDQNERITVAIVNPVLPCSARFIVFMVLSSAIYGPYAGLIVTGLYFMGVTISILMMFLLRKTILKGETLDLLLEMPDLSLPTTGTIVSAVFLQVRKFIEGAATWMALGVIVLWGLSISGPTGYLGPEALNDSDLLRESWIFIIGDFIQPIFSIFDWDSQLVTALIFGFIAKEIVIASLGLIYGVSGDLGALDDILQTQFTPVSAFAFMVFVLVYTPCIGTYFALRQEVGSKWANVSVINGLVIGWLLAFSTIMIGGMIL